MTGPVTPDQAKEIAALLGLQKTNYRAHEQAIYRWDNLYVSRDADGHHGGVWKVAGSVEELQRNIRYGTYNADLTERIGD